jgi:hypothetical protein
MFSLLFLEPMCCEFQCAAILDDRPHNILGRSCLNFRLDLKRHFHVDPTSPARCEIISSAIQPASRPTRAVIADLGEEAAWRNLEFFTANIHNPNTHRAYAPRPRL